MVLVPLGRIVTVAFSLSLPQKDPHPPRTLFTRHFGSRSAPDLRSPVQRGFRLNSHCAVVSPIASAVPMAGSYPSDIPSEAKYPPIQSSASLLKLCSLLDAAPEDLLRLESTSDGVRGVCLNRKVKKGDVLLSMPLASCLQDDDPPDWMSDDAISDSLKDSEEVGVSYSNPSDWATRLAASLLDLQLRKEHVTDSEKGESLWLSMLPDPTFLRASLPIHWTEDILLSARCTALELAMDSAYFARAEAIEDLLAGLRRCDLVHGRDEKELRNMCQNALDLVQTRSCRVEPKDGVMWGPPLRILAPIFDFINHGSCKRSDEGGANAFFGLEGGEVTDLDDPTLVVRAVRDLEAGDEVLIDYGESARPGWRCLASYGFVPEYKDGGDEDVAEVYMNGVRYEVGASTVPFEMVETVAASVQGDEAVRGEMRTVYSMLNGAFHNNEQLEYGDGTYDESPPQSTEDAETMLSPAVAVKIATRLTDVAFQLLLDPDDPEADTDDEAADLRSSWLAASLRWSQHRILLACSMGLRDWVTQQS